MAFRPAHVHHDDWLVDGHPVVADGFEPGEVLPIDRFRCVSCGQPLSVVVDTARTGAVDVAVTCGTCDVDQVANVVVQEWQPARFVAVAHGTSSIPVVGRPWSTWIAASVLVAIVATLVVVNVAAARAAWNERLDARDGVRIDADLLRATETGGGPRMIPSHHLLVEYRYGDLVRRRLEVDGSTFSRYVDADEVPLWVRRDHVTVVDDHEQRNDLYAVLAIDATILATMLGIAFTVWRSARDARREPS